MSKSEVFRFSDIQLLAQFQAVRFLERFLHLKSELVIGQMGQNIQISDKWDKTSKIIWFEPKSPITERSYF